MKSQVSSGFKINVDLQHRLPNFKRYNSIFNYDMDVCRLLKSLRSSLYKKWLSSVHEYGNFTKKCPAPAGYYYVRDWQLNEDLVPAFILSGQYRLNVYAYYGRRNTSSEDMFLDSQAALMGIALV
ncbi:uncharacterized protein LOC108598028 [Drosophila busckii]|uniref:uncharacterized protein LOC108598028 n=1 Tax=Drosophila busckii TaxID=30019 RepID=UPI00083EA00A|nr:uncharacterized protein LOC108598028 [Drosophila busckii]